MKQKIVFIHPAIRTYRSKIFELLSNKFDITFFWSGESNPNSFVEKEVDSLLKNSKLNYIQAKELKFLPFDNFSIELLTLPFKNYNIYIFSSILSVPFLLLTPFLKLLGKKIIVFDELWIYPHNVKKYKLIYSYVKFLLKTCTNSLVLSGTKSKDFFKKEFNFGDKDIFIAYNTTTNLEIEITADVKKYKDKFNQLTKKKKILYLARIIKIKGLDLLIESMQYINKDYDLIIVGDGPFLEECINLVSKYNLNDRVHFLGECERKDVVNYYINSDIFVLPSRFLMNENVQVESWGYTINEVMSIGLPVVTTTAVGSSYDLIIDKETGCLAQENDVKDLVNKINYIIENNQDNKIGKKGKKHLNTICNYEENLLSFTNAINN